MLKRVYLKVYSIYVCFAYMSDYSFYFSLLRFSLSKRERHFSNELGHSFYYGILAVSLHQNRIASYHFNFDF